MRTNPAAGETVQHPEGQPATAESNVKEFLFKIEVAEDVHARGAPGRGAVAVVRAVDRGIMGGCRGSGVSKGDPLGKGWPPGALHGNL